MFPYVEREVEIARKGRAIQSGLYFFKEPLNDGLAMSGEVDRATGSKT